jgi:hypothetical protein
MTQAASTTPAPVEFRNVSEAIRVLRSGKKDERWYSAAEFLIARATPEVTLMLDVGRELGRLGEIEKQAVRRKPVPWKWVWIVLGISLAALLSGYFLARLIQGICI